MTAPHPNRRRQRWAVWGMFAAAALQSFLGGVGWTMNSLSFDWRDWLFSLSGGMYFGLGIAAVWFLRSATLVGAGTYAAFLALQAHRSAAALNSGIILKVPVAAFLLLALAAAWWHTPASRKVPAE